MLYLYPKPHTLSPKKGFTLIELLVVISIIAILSTIGLVSYGQIQKNARDAKRKSDLRSMKVALELYYQKNKQYPVAENWIYSSASPPWISQLTVEYLGTLPTDPLGGDKSPWNEGNYGYSYFAGNCASYTEGQYFALVTQLENKSDPERNELKDYKWCDGTGLYSYQWGPAGSNYSGAKYMFIVTSQ